MYLKRKSIAHQVFNPLWGKEQWSQYPQTREDAFEERIRFYEPIPAKKDCDHDAGSIIYTLTNIKRCCALHAAVDAYNKAYKDGEPLNPSNARHRGLDYYWTHKPGAQCGHVGKVLLNGACFTCQQEDTGRSPRQAAILAGEKWYMPLPGDRCPNGHYARRRVQSGSCEECEKIARNNKPASTRSDKPYLLLPSDTILSKEDAKLLGFTAYRTGVPCHKGHTGWRYISTGGCIDCKEGK